MSKYIKSGKSRFAKPIRGDSPATTAQSFSVSNLVDRSNPDLHSIDYSEHDNQHFQALTNQISSIRVQSPAVPSVQNYQTPYSTQDAELFEQLHPVRQTFGPNRQSPFTRGSDRRSD